MIGKAFYLDGWTVNTSGGSISRGSDTVRLEPQVMKVLVYLAERAGDVVTRQELLDELWGQSFVGDAALTRCVYEIRQAFGDSAKEPRIVETVPKIGFRLVAEPSLERPKYPVTRRRAFWVAAASLALLAIVLPIRDAAVKGKPSDTFASPAAPTYHKAREYLAVPTRAANLNAIALFERAVREDPRLALAYAGLANALSQQAIYWGGQRTDEAYDAASSALRLAPDMPRSHNAMGMVHQARRDYAAALESFETAIRLDPGYVDAIYNSADIHRRELDFDKAAQQYLAVLDVDPQHMSAMRRLGFVYVRTGDLVSARAWLDRVMDTSPMDGYTNLQLAALELVAGNTTTALEICESLLELYPTQRMCLNILGSGNLKLGNYEEAQRWFNLQIDTYDDGSYGELGVAQVMMATGQTAEGLAIVDDLLGRFLEMAEAGEAGWSEYWMIAACLALKGENDLALVWLNRTFDAGRRFPLWDAMDSAFVALHGDQRFEQYLSRSLVESRGSM